MNSFHDHRTYNSYRRFWARSTTTLHDSCIADLCSKAAPLYKFLRENVEFDWTDECDKALHVLKESVIKATKLTHFDQTKPVVLATDASNYGIGAVLLQKENGAERPLAHASKKWSAHQKNHFQIEKEAFSIIYGVSRFRQYLYGRGFTLITDHKPLVAMFSTEKIFPFQQLSNCRNGPSH